MKRIFLTGTSAGIGLATTEALLAAGHEVWGTSRHPERLPRLERFHPIGLDLRNENEIEAGFATASQEAGQFDVVINNAGSGHFGPGQSLPLDVIEDQFQVLFCAHVRIVQLALAQMQPRDAGLIINITSLAGRLPVPFMAAYNALKAALSVFTMTVQVELGQSRVRLVDLQPADICTRFNDSVIMADPGDRYAQAFAKTLKAVERNMAAAPKPELVARRILRLIEDDNPPPRVTVGDAFQTKLAPFIFRFLPQRLRIWGLKKYYGI